jgi:small subunit ribosomal protein S8
VSRPGRRVYVTKDKIPSILGGMGVAILSTSSGVMTDRQVRKQHLGGEVLAYVW